jgi:adenosylcobinamide-GDP ribazoletransferase
VRSWRTAVSLFTVFPVSGEAELGEGEAARAVLWLPVVGLLLGLAGGVVMLAVEAGGADDHSGPRRLLGAALAVALIAVATGGLHLDGLADTADGLGSRRAPADALAIMRRSDVGPMGVAALVLLLLIQVSALAAVQRASAAAAALVLAAVTGRAAVVVATGAPAARPGGFGALVASRTTARARVWAVAGLGCAVAAAGLAAGAAGLTPNGVELAARGLAAALSGLLAGWLLQQVARRRLGGMTGDVFGAIVEVSAATVLVTCVLLS